MVSISDLRRKFIERTRKRKPVGLKLTRFGKIFKVRKHKT